MLFLDQRGIFDCWKQFSLNYISKYINFFLSSQNNCKFDYLWYNPFSESLSLLIHICQHNDTLSPAWKVSSSLRTKHDNRRTCKVLSKQQHSALAASTVPALQSSAAVFPFSQAPVGKVWTSPRGTSKEMMSALSFFSTKAVNGSGSCTQKDHSQGPPDWAAMIIFG